MTEKKRKPADEMSSDELVQYALSPKVHRHLKKLTSELDAKQKPDQKPGKKPPSQ